MRSLPLAILALSVLTSGCGFSNRAVTERVANLSPEKPTFVRRDALIWLGEHAKKRLTKAGREKLVEVIGTVLEEDEDRLARSYAAVALARLGDKSAVRYLRSALRDKDYMVRWDAVKALTALKATDVTPEIAEMALGDSNLDVRIAAIEALAALGGRASIPELLRLLGDRQQSVAFASQRSLTSLTGKDFGLDQDAWLHWWRQAMHQEKPQPSAKPKKKRKKWLFF